MTERERVETDVQPRYVEPQVVALHSGGREKDLRPEGCPVRGQAPEPLRLRDDPAGEPVVGVVADHGKDEPIDRSCHGGGEREGSEHGSAENLRRSRWNVRFSASAGGERRKPDEAPDESSIDDEQQRVA